MAVTTSARLSLTQRPRRLRRTEAIRSLVRETRLTPDCFIYPLFVTEGEGLRRLDGSYRFEPEDDSTRVHYELAVDIAIPLPGLIKRRAAGMIMGTALKELKKAVESSTS